MLGLLPRYIFNFIFLITLQVLILNRIEFSGYLNPYLYVLFILTLPFETPGWLLLFLSLIMGLTIDMFSNTPGMHMAASLLLAYLRPLTLMRISPRDSYEPGTLPLPGYYGFPWFFKYAAILIFIHHTFYFIIESFSLNNILSILFKSISSTLFTLVIMAITLLFTYKKRQRI